MIDLMTDTPSACASRLARYITDASKIRAYVLHSFGHAPSLPQIDELILGWQAARTTRQLRTERKAQPSDVLHWQPRSLIGTRTPAKAPVAPPEPRQAPTPVRMVPRARVTHEATALGPSNRVLKRAAEMFAVQPSAITGKGKTDAIVLPRDCVAYTIRTCGEGKVSYPQIGRLLGGRDHSTVIHAVRKITLRLEAGDEWLSDILAELSDAWHAQPRLEVEA